MLKWLITTLIRKPFLLISCIALSFMNCAFELAVPYITAKFIDDVVMIEKYATLYIYCGIFFIFVLFEIIIKFYADVFVTKLLSHMHVLILSTMVHRISRREYSFFQSIDSGYLSDRINRDVYDLTTFTVNSLFASITGGCTISGAILYLINVDVLLLTAFLLLLAGYIIFFFFIQKKLRLVSLDVREKENHYFNEISKLFRSIISIKLHVLYDIYRERVDGALLSWAEQNIHREKLSFWFSQSGIIAGRLFLCMFFLIGGINLINKNITVGEFVAINRYFILAIEGTAVFLNIAQSYLIAYSAYTRIVEYDGIKPITNFRVFPTTPIYSIEIENLSYAIKGQYLLKDVNMSFKKGTMYCIVGPNGSGKSTLINLLTGLLYPTSGSIRYNDLKTTDMNMAEVRANLISISEQHPFLCQEELLSHGNFDLLAFFKFSSPNLIGTTLKEATLSGGELQKIAHATFIHPDKELIILDEPTSAMDIEDAFLFWKYLQKLKKGRIIIIISHKSEEVALADIVIHL